MRSFIEERVSGRRALIAVSLLAIVALLAVGVFNIQVKGPGGDNGGLLSVSAGQRTLVIGAVDSVAAAGTVDYTCDGVADNVQFQAALNALPAGGGRISVLAGTYVFAAGTSVTRAIDNVAISGVGRATYFTGDGVTAIFVAGGNNWKFEDLRTDAGSLNMGASTGWEWSNVTIAATHYPVWSENGQVRADTFRSDVATGTAPFTIASTTTSTNLSADLVDGYQMARSATVFVAANDATATEKAQADYLADGVADQVQVNAAIAAAAGGHVKLSTGTFAIADDVTVNQAGTWLQGAGRGATSIVAVAASNAQIYVTSNNAIVSDLTVDQNGPDQTADWGVRISGNDGMVARVTVVDGYYDGYIVEGDRNKLIDVEYYESDWAAPHTSSGIEVLEGADDTEIVRPYVHNALNAQQGAIFIIAHDGTTGPRRTRIESPHITTTNNGIVFSMTGAPLAYPDDTTITNVNIHDVSGAGIVNTDGTDATRVNVIGGVVKNNTNRGIDGTFDVVEGIQITGNTLEGFNGLALVLSNNYIASNADSGAHVWGPATVSGNYFAGNNTGGTGTGSLEIEGNEVLVVGNTFVSVQAGWHHIRLSGGSVRQTITGNYISGATNGIYAANGGVTALIVGNTFYDNTYGVDMTSAGGVTIVSNTFLTSGTAHIRNPAGIVRNNIGWVTENSGTATINSGSTAVTITHGLSYTPVAGDFTVVFTENPSNDPGNWWVDTITATQANINVRSDPGASNLDVSWSVRKVN